MEEVEKTGGFHLGAPLSKLAKSVEFVAGTAAEQDVRDAIGERYRADGRVIDPHTAVAMKVAIRCRDTSTKMLVAETASPVKFPELIGEVLGIEVPRSAHLVGLEDRPPHFTELPVDVGAVKEYVSQHAL